jgi:hypothetical protein
MSDTHMYKTRVALSFWCLAGTWTCEAIRMTIPMEMRNHCEAINRSPFRMTRQKFDDFLGSAEDSEESDPIGGTVSSIMSCSPILQYPRSFNY